jgi:glycosyltransferase involved in cell wall biosynthesis
MCLRKPVIVSSHVGCAEDLVEQERTGLLFEAGNVEALAAALTNAFQSRDRLRAWGEAARIRVETFNYAEATRGLMRSLAYVTRTNDV